MILSTRLPLTQSVHRLVEPDAWTEHIPFLTWLIEVQRPRVFVELGTHTGNSYCAACQTVASLDLATRCWAIDTWRGDEHAGFYDDSVYEELKSYHDPLYGAFSQLLRCTFDEAVGTFDDELIDLLHIDGLHTYAAVKHDFESWLPKLAPGGVVLFHDIDERERGFEVWRLWSELASKYPSFEFSHGHGLGLLMPKGRKEFLAPLLDTKGTPEEPAVKSLFAALGRSNTLQLALQRQVGEVERLRADLSRSHEQAELLRAQLEESQAQLERSRAQAEEAHTLVDELAGKIEMLHQRHGEVLSHATSLTKQWKSDAEKLRRQNQAASTLATLTAGQLQRRTDSIARMQSAFDHLRNRFLNGSALRDACQATALQVQRLYHGSQRTMLGRILIRTRDWDRIDALIKEATESSDEGKNHQACGLYLEAVDGGLMLLKKIRRNHLLRAVLRGYLLNSLERQFAAQWQLYIEAGQMFQEATSVVHPQESCPADFYLDLVHYSGQAQCQLPDVDAAFRHYSEEGWKCGLDPHPLFSTSLFIDRNHDLIHPAANPLAEYHRLLTEGHAPEAHIQFSGSWLRSYFLETLPTDLREGFGSIPAKPTDPQGAAAFSKLPPRAVIGIILFHASEEEVSRTIRILHKAADEVAAAGFTRPQFVFTDNSHQWNADTVKAQSAGTESLIHFLPTPENVGFGRGHNLLMSHAFEALGATHYLCLNPDGYLHPDALAEMIHAALRQGRPALVEALQAPCEHPKEYDPVTLETNWSTGGCLLIPRFLFELTGGFDDRFFLYCEDVDFSWTVWSHGYPCVVAPRALFHHRMMSRKHDSKVDQWYLESGRLLGAKWGNTRFRLLCERYLIERQYYESESALPSVGEPSISYPHTRVDFGNLFTFARARW
ncbi:MAG: class I SAM-dependent methyltransferase [Chthoniobacter sp.]